MRAKAVDRIAEQFPDFVVKHLPGRVVVMRERLYGKPSVNTMVVVASRSLSIPGQSQRVEIQAEPVPGGWAYARAPRDLMRA